MEGGDGPRSDNSFNGCTNKGSNGNQDSKSSIRWVADHSGVSAKDDIFDKAGKISEDLEKSFSHGTKNKISNILGDISQLSDVEKLFLYLKLPSYPTISKDHHQSHRDSHPTCTAWIKTHLGEDPTTCLPRHEVYDEYKEFCASNSLHCINQMDFSKSIRRIFPSVKLRRLGQRGKSKSCFGGLKKVCDLQLPVLPKIELDITSGQDAAEESGMDESEMLDDDDDDELQAAETLIYEWAEKLLGHSVNNMTELAERLIERGVVGRQSMAAFTIIASAPHLANIPTAEKNTGGQEVEEKRSKGKLDVRAQLQRKLQEKKALGEQKRLMQEQFSGNEGKKSSSSSRTKDDRQDSNSHSSMPSKDEKKTDVNNYENPSNGGKKVPVNDGLARLSRSGNKKPLTPQKPILPKPASVPSSSQLAFVSDLSRNPATCGITASTNGSLPAPPVFIIPQQSQQSVGTSNIVIFSSPVQTKGAVSSNNLSPATDNQNGFDPASATKSSSAESLQPSSVVIAQSQISSARPLIQRAQSCPEGDKPSHISTQSPAKPPVQMLVTTKEAEPQDCDQDTALSSAVSCMAPTPSSNSIASISNQVYSCMSAASSPLMSSAPGSTENSQDGIKLSNGELDLIKSEKSCTDTKSKEGGSKRVRSSSGGKTVSSLLKETRGYGPTIDIKTYVNDKRPVAQVLKEKRERESQMKHQTGSPVAPPVKLQQLAILNNLQTPLSNSLPSSPLQLLTSPHEAGTGVVLKAVTITQPPVPTVHLQAAKMSQNIQSTSTTPKMAVGKVGESSGDKNLSTNSTEMMASVPKKLSGDKQFSPLQRQSSLNTTGKKQSLRVSRNKSILPKKTAQPNKRCEENFAQRHSELQTLLMAPVTEAGSTLSISAPATPTGGLGNTNNLFSRDQSAVTAGDMVKAHPVLSQALGTLQTTTTGIGNSSGTSTASTISGKSALGNTRPKNLQELLDRCPTEGVKAHVCHLLRTLISQQDISNNNNTQNVPPQYEQPIQNPPSQLTVASSQNMSSMVQAQHQQQPGTNNIHKPSTLSSLYQDAMPEFCLNEDPSSDLADITPSITTQMVHPLPLSNPPGLVNMMVTGTSQHVAEDDSNHNQMTASGPNSRAPSQNSQPDPTHYFSPTDSQAKFFSSQSCPTSALQQPQQQLQQQQQHQQQQQQQLQQQQQSQHQQIFDFTSQSNANITQGADNIPPEGPSNQMFSRLFSQANQNPVQGQIKTAWLNKPGAGGPSSGSGNIFDFKDNHQPVRGHSGRSQVHFVTQDQTTVAPVHAFTPIEGTTTVDGLVSPVKPRGILACKMSNQPSMTDAMFMNQTQTNLGSGNLIMYNNPHNGGSVNSSAANSPSGSLNGCNQSEDHCMDMTVNLGTINKSQGSADSSGFLPASIIKPMKRGAPAADNKNNSKRSRHHSAQDTYRTRGTDFMNVSLQPKLASIIANSRGSVSAVNSPMSSPMASPLASPGAPPNPQIQTIINYSEPESPFSPEIENIMTGNQGFSCHNDQLFSENMSTIFRSHSVPVHSMHMFATGDSQDEFGNPSAETIDQRLGENQDYMNAIDPSALASLLHEKMQEDSLAQTHLRPRAATMHAGGNFRARKNITELLQHNSASATMVGDSEGQEPLINNIPISSLIRGDHLISGASVRPPHLNWQNAVCKALSNNLDYSQLQQLQQRLRHQRGPGPTPPSSQNPTPDFSTELMGMGNSVVGEQGGTVGFAGMQQVQAAPHTVISSAMDTPNSLDTYTTQESQEDITPDMALYTDSHVSMSIQGGLSANTQAEWLL